MFSESSNSAGAYIVGCVFEGKPGGATCRVKIHRRKPDLRYVNGRGKVIVDPHRLRINTKN